MYATPTFQTVYNQVLRTNVVPSGVDVRPGKVFDLAVPSSAAFHTVAAILKWDATTTSGKTVIAEGSLQGFHNGVLHYTAPVSFIYKELIKNTVEYVPGDVVVFASPPQNQRMWKCTLACGPSLGNFDWMVVDGNGVPNPTWWTSFNEAIPTCYRSFESFLGTVPTQDSVVFSDPTWGNRHTFTRQISGEFDSFSIVLDRCRNATNYLTAGLVVLSISP